MIAKGPESRRKSLGSGIALIDSIAFTPERLFAIRATRFEKVSKTISDFSDHYRRRDLLGSFLFYAAWKDGGAVRIDDKRYAVIERLENGSHRVYVRKVRTNETSRI